MLLNDFFSSVMSMYLVFIKLSFFLLFDYIFLVGLCNDRLMYFPSLLVVGGIDVKKMFSFYNF